MPIERICFDWSSPALPAATGFLVERYRRGKVLDLDQVIVAVPGQRARRRLMELLVERSEADGLALVPPDVVTAGSLPELLYEAHKPFACELTQHLAWVKALLGIERRRAMAFASTLPAGDDLADWLPLGELLAGLHLELAADGLDFDDVVRLAAQFLGQEEQARWQVLAELQTRYLCILDQLELWDRQTARLYAIKHGECRTEKAVVLVGMVDMPRVQQSMLEQVAHRVATLVFAPPELAHRFDDFGCLKAAAWQDVTVDIQDDQIMVADGPADQANAVLDALAALEGKYATGEVVIGVPDERLVPHVEQCLAEARLASHSAAGLPLARSGLARLLEAMADYLEDGLFASFAALVRHPAMAPWFLQHGIRGDCLAELDKCFSNHLPALLRAEQMQAGDPGVRRLCQITEELLADLSGPPRALVDWGEAILNVVQAVYGIRTLDEEIEADRQTIRACEKLVDALREHSQVTADLAAPVTGALALRLLLRSFEHSTVPSPFEPSAIELLGWLDLPWDDAPALIVTGMNEGIVPQSHNADLFLPNSVRRHLELQHNERRFARDSYALCVLAASRSFLRLIAGRRSPENDPLVPSRLLFACDRPAMARRTRNFYSRRGNAPPAFGRRGIPAAQELRIDVPKPASLKEPLRSMRVTEFRDYLTCPYRYYLQHCLGLERQDDAADEMDGRLFGNLLHAVLASFARGPAAGSSSVDEIAGDLDRLLDSVADAWFTSGTLPAVRVQIEQARLRLRGFARWQASSSAQGWRIAYAEQSFDGEMVPFVVDEAAVFLRGRIDRIDINDQGDVRILDYKTGDAAAGPDKTHRTRDGWVDLQLPLYRHMVPCLGLTARAQLGYIVLPKDGLKIDLCLAKWSDDDLHSADETARDIVRKIRKQVFWPPAKLPSSQFDDFANVCQASRFGGAPELLDETVLDVTGA